MVSRIALLILAFCFFFDLSSSYHVKKGKPRAKVYVIDGTPRSIEGAEHHVQFIDNITYFRAGPRQNYFCGGSLITYEIVVTAGHCVAHIMHEKKVDVYAGSAKLYDYVEKRFGVKFLIHPYWTKNDQFDKDIGMIKVDKPFTSSKIAPIPLTMAPPKGSEQVTVNGFGIYEKYSQESSSVLRELRGTLANCTRPEINIRSDFCVQRPVGKGVCNGDSGGGVVNSKLELSGIAAMTFEECGETDMDLYTSIYDHLNFIVAGLQYLSPDDVLATQIVKKVYDVFTEKIGSL